MKKLFSCLAFLVAFLTSSHVMAGGGGGMFSTFYAKSTVAVAEESSGRGTVYFEDNQSEKTETGSAMGESQYISFNVFITPAEGYKFDKFTEENGQEFTFNADSNPNTLVVVATSTDASAPSQYNFKAHFVEAGGPVESVAITDAEGNALVSMQNVNVTTGETVKFGAVVSPENAENKNVTWEVIQEGEFVSIDQNGLVTALAPGKAAVVVTTEDGEKQATVYVIVADPQPSTIADFLANGGTCYLTGIVSNIDADNNANFALTDATGNVNIMGCQDLPADVENGNEIVIKASYYDKTLKAILGSSFVENHGTPVAPVYTFEVEAGEETFTVTPSDNEVKYYIEIVPANLDIEALISFFDSQLDDMGSGLEYFSGVQTQSYAEDWYIDEPGDYQIAVCAVNENYERVSEIATATFTIEADEPADDNDLTAAMFHKWDGYDENANIVDENGGSAYEVGNSTDLVYGTGAVWGLHYADLSNYDKLIITVSEGTPRCMFNRPGDDGAMPVETPRDAQYQTVEGNVYTIDLAAIKAEYGYVHLQAIKGANWAKVTVESMKLVAAETPTPEPVAPEITFDVENEAEVDLAETKSIHVSVAVPEGVEADADLYIEGTLFGKDNTNLPIIGYTDFEDGVDVALSQLTPGNAYTIMITKVAYGEVIGGDENGMPIYENVFEAAEGESLATLDFSIAKEEITDLGEIVATYYENGPVIDIVFKDQTDVAPSYSVDILLDGEKLNVELGQGWNELYGYPGKKLAAGDHTIVFPIGSLMLNSQDTNAAECSVTFTVAGATPEPVKDCALTTEMFKEWDSFGADANEVGQAGSVDGFGTLTQSVYGDMSVFGKNYADLSAYTALSIKVNEGSPRLLFNRQSMDGSSSDFLQIQGNGPAEYVTVVGDYYVYNLAKIIEDKGYAHLNCIKGFWVDSNITDPVLHTEATFEEVLEEIKALGVSSIATSNAKDGKFLQNGKVVIVKNGQKFNAAGARILK